MLPLGSEVLSGSINKSGLIEVKVTSVYKNSTVSRILSLVETATERKTKTETVVSKYAPVYTLSVLIVAILVGALFTTNNKLNIYRKYFIKL